MKQNHDNNCWRKPHEPRQQDEGWSEWRRGLYCYNIHLYRSHCHIGTKPAFLSNKNVIALKISLLLRFFFTSHSIPLQPINAASSSSSNKCLTNDRNWIDRESVNTIQLWNNIVFTISIWPLSNWNDRIAWNRLWFTLNWLRRLHCCFFQKKKKQFSFFTLFKTMFCFCWFKTIKLDSFSLIDFTN